MTARDTAVLLAEVFGPTVQGEGPFTGRAASFVRFGRCNLDCSWCDTPFTWDWRGKNGRVYVPTEELSTWTVGEVLERVSGWAPRLLVVTGGEPLVQESALAALAAAAVEDGFTVQIETNGTRPVDPALHALVTVVASPKLANSGVPEGKRLRLEVLADLAAAGAAFKFVAVEHADLAEIDEVVAAAGVPAGQVWVMGEGRSAAVLAERRSLVEWVVGRGWNWSPRLHVELWGDERGR